MADVRPVEYCRPMSSNPQAVGRDFTHIPFAQAAALVSVRALIRVCENPSSSLVELEAAGREAYSDVGLFLALVARSR